MDSTPIHIHLLCHKCSDSAVQSLVSFHPLNAPKEGHGFSALLGELNVNLISTGLQTHECDLRWNENGAVALRRHVKMLKERSMHETTRTMHPLGAIASIISPQVRQLGEDFLIHSSTQLISVESSVHEDTSLPLKDLYGLVLARVCQGFGIYTESSCGKALFRVGLSHMAMLDVSVPTTEKEAALKVGGLHLEIRIHSTCKNAVVQLHMGLLKVLGHSRKASDAHLKDTMLQLAARVATIKSDLHKKALQVRNPSFTTTSDCDL